MNKAFKQWSKGCLPDNFYQVCGEVGRIQAFLQETLPQELNKEVQVINANSELIVIAASNAQIANYLRLYQMELQQQIRETFHSQQVLRVKTFPDQTLAVETKVKISKPQPLSDATVEKLESSADCIEHSELSESLKSLADSIRRSRS